MPSYSKGSIILVKYPFSDLLGAKVRPAIVVNGNHSSQDLIIVPLTSRVQSLMAGEFILADWQKGGLNVPSAAKRGLYIVQANLCLKHIGQLLPQDQAQLDLSLKYWLDL